MGDGFVTVVDQVDDGYGIAKEALLLFDLKTSHKEYLASKGYTLQDLLQGKTYVQHVHFLVW